MLKKSKKGVQKALKSNLNLIKASLKGEKVRYRDRSYVLNEIEQLALLNINCELQFHANQVITQLICYFFKEVIKY